MEEKYIQMLKAIHVAIETWNTNYPDSLHPMTRTVGYLIELRLERTDHFERIDWLADNGYITITPKDWWCDMTDSYWESYAITEKGKEELSRRMVGRK